MGIMALREDVVCQLINSTPYLCKFKYIEPRNLPGLIFSNVTEDFHIPFWSNCKSFTRDNFANVPEESIDSENYEQN